MDEIEKRLEEASEICVKAYRVWSEDKKNSSGKEKLQESIHELRKVAARLEIELAVSERDEEGNPIPILGHRSHGQNQKPPQQPRQGNQQKPHQNNSGNGGRKDSDVGELPSFISGDSVDKNAPDAPKRAPRRRLSRPKTDG